MKEIILCGFNMDTVCVEAVFADGSKISIDCTAVENALKVNTIQQAELDWLVYNEPITYVNLILHGSVDEYRSYPPLHTLQE